MGRGKIKASELLDRLWQQRFRCALTGAELEPTNAVPDHRTPLSRGGRHRIDNVDIVGREVNRAKGDMTTAEFVGLCKQVAKFWRKKQ